MTCSIEQHKKAKQVVFDNITKLIKENKDIDTTGYLEALEKLHGELKDGPMIDYITAMGALQEGLLPEVVELNKNIVKGLYNVNDSYVGDLDPVTIHKVGTDIRILGITTEKGVSTVRVMQLGKAAGSNAGNVYTYVFDSGSDTSRSTSRGGVTLTIPGISRKIEEELRKSNTGKEIPQFFKDFVAGKGLGNSYDNETIKKIADFTKYENFSTDTIQGVKDTLDALHVLSGSKATPEQIQQYHDILDTWKPSFFRELKLYVAENRGKSQGWINVDKGTIHLSLAKGNVPVAQTEAEVYMHELVHAITYWGLRAKGVDSRSIKRKLRYAQLEAARQTKPEDLLGKPRGKATKEELEEASKLYNYLFKGENSLEEFIAYANTNPIFKKHLEGLDLRRAEGKTLSEYITDGLKLLIDVVMGNYSFADRDASIAEQVGALTLRLGEINYDGYQQAVSMNPLALLSQLVDSGLDVLDKGAAMAISAIVDAVAPSSDKLPPFRDDMTVVEKTKWVMSATYKAFTHNVYRDVIGVWMTNLWGKLEVLAPEGDLRQYFSDFRQEDDAKRMVNELALKRQYLDSLRNGQAQGVKTSVLAGFKRPLAVFEEEALTEVLIDTNAGHLVYSKEGRVGINNARLRDLLTDDKKLEWAINNVQKEITEKLKKDPARGNVVKGLSMLLGYYMATGKATEATIFNARGIAVGHGTPARFKEDKELIAMIKELSSLVAMKHTDRKAKNVVAGLLVEERDGVYKVLDTYEKFKLESRKDLFSHDEAHMMDGYSKELFDASIMTSVAPLSSKEEMEDKGFTLSGPVKVQTSAQSEPMGLYVSSSYSKAERQAAASNMGNFAAKGMSIRELSYSASAVLGESYFAKDKNQADEKASKIILEMAKGNIDLSSLSYGMGRVVDAQGKTVDYRLMMPKTTKKELLKQDKRVSEVLGWSVASVQDKVARRVHDKMVLEAIKVGMKEWEDNGKGEQGGVTGYEEYDLIGPNSRDSELKDLFYMLPAELQAFAQAREDKTIAIPRRLRILYFGYHHPKFSNAIGIRDLPIWIRKLIDNMESLLVDAVSLVKGTILVKLPFTVTTNIISNFLQVWSMGVSMTDALTLHGESIRDVRKYIKDHREKLATELAISQLKANRYRVENKNSITRRKNILFLEIDSKKKALARMLGGPEYDALLEEIGEKEAEFQTLSTVQIDTSGDRIEREIVRLEAQIDILNKSMEESPIRELIDAGLMQSIVEDVNTASMNDKNRVSRWVEDMMKDAPGVVKTAGDILYLSDKTTWYKTVQEMLQMSDLVARDVVNRKMVMMEEERVEGERDFQPEMIEAMAKVGVTLVNGVKLRGKDRDAYLAMSKASRIHTLQTRFINYAQPNGRYEEYANRIGLLMFTKYFKRIQRELMAMSGEAPVRALLGLGITALGLDTVQGQSLLVKGDGFDGTFGLGNLMPVHSPVDNFLMLVNPPLIALSNKLL